jgi:3-deoxy-D-manno-octulosonic-acid transferase
MLAIYRGLSNVAAPLISAYLARRMAAGKEDAARFGERLGKPSKARPPGPLAWVHGASVGESLSALPLIERLLQERPDLHVLVTTGTVTSAAVMAERLPARAFHQYVPVDRVPFVARFLDHWRPELALWIESDLWPNLLVETRRRGTPALLLNARMSPRSFARWRRIPPLIRPLIAGFALCLAQNAGEAERLARLGAPRVKTVGNLKYAAAPLPADGRELRRLEEAMGERPRWLAASTHPGEEDIAADVHRRIASAHPGLLSLIVPRHPGRGARIAAALAAKGFSVALRSAGEAPGRGSEIYVADTMGELGLFYRLCAVTFVGGSLVPHGGHNLLEPGKLGCAVVHGPHMTNFRGIADEMDAAGAALEVRDEAALATAVSALLRDPERSAGLAAAAAGIARSKAVILDNVMAEIEPFLGPAPAPEARHACA